MAANDKKNVMGYDPLAWLGQDTEDLAVDNDIDETEIDVQAEETQLDFADIDSSEEAIESLSAQINDDEILNFDSDENEMNAIAELPESQVSDEEAETAGDIAEPTINLGATLTIQNVVKLHEKIKKSYAANNAIEINASKVSSIDTATLQLLVALKKDAVKKQKEVVFSKPSGRFKESAELLGLLELLDI